MPLDCGRFAAKCKGSPLPRVLRPLGFLDVSRDTSVCVSRPPRSRPAGGRASGERAARRARRLPDAVTQHRLRARAGDRRSARCAPLRRPERPAPGPAPQLRARLDGAVPRPAGRATPTCAGDTVDDPRMPILRYGHMWRRGAFVCASRLTGVTCPNRAGHGFVLAREALAHLRVRRGWAALAALAVSATLFAGRGSTWPSPPTDAIIVLDGDRPPAGSDAASNRGGGSRARRSSSSAARRRARLLDRPLPFEVVSFEPSRARHAARPAPSPASRATEAGGGS